ncbi:MAG: sensor histidine kinase [Ignavibacteria bacterium]|nr:sensor histidine kinase [Ignavibacteria bacterium]
MLLSRRSLDTAFALFILSGLLLVFFSPHSFAHLYFTPDTRDSSDNSIRSDSLGVIEFGIDGKPSTRHVTARTKYWIDTAQTMTVQRLMQSPISVQGFRKATTSSVLLGNGHRVVWIQFVLQRLPERDELKRLADNIGRDSIKSKGTHDDGVRAITLAQARLSEALCPWVLLLENRSADSVEFYMTRGDSIIYADTVGYSVSYSRWHVPSMKIAFPLPIGVGERMVCYVRMNMNGIMYYGVAVQPERQFAERTFNFKLPLFIFYGVTIFAIIFSLLSWILTRSRYYGLYGFYIVCLTLSISIDMGHFYQVFEVSAPHLNNRLYILSWLTSMAVGVFFVREFVREQRSIVVPKIWEWLAYLFWVCCLIALVAEFADARGVSLDILYYSYLILAVPTTLGMSFSAWRGGYRPALYVFASRVIVEIGIGANSLAALGMISYSSIWVSQLSLLVPAVEMMLMGLALADRITVLQRAKQEAERKALQGELYRLQNEELSSANKEITRQQSEIMQQAAEIQEMNAQVTELNISLQQQNHDLAEANREKNEIMGIVAHDLKNPIGGVRGMAELIESVFADDRTQTTNAARQIIQTSERMLELVSKLLDINKLESGEFAMDCYAFDIVPIISMIIEQYAAPAVAKNITFHTELPATSRSIVFANEQAVMQALENIISNAVKYSPHGKNVYVRVKNVVASLPNEADGSAANNASSFVRVEVEDEGPGFTEEDKTKLFGKFARLSAQPTGGEHSTGLGLSIVKRMVEAMSGRVWCESEAGKGATFIVQLPTSISEASYS